MKTFFFCTLFVILGANAGLSQWQNAYFPNPVAFGVDDTSFFASSTYGSNSVFRFDSSSPYSYVERDTGLTKNSPVKAFGVAGSYAFACPYGIYRSSDNGSHWTLLNKYIGLGSIDAFATIDTMIFAGGDSVYRSTDNGQTWKGLARLGVTAFATSSTNLFAGTASGVFRSTDSGQTWQATSMTTGVSGIAVVGTVILAATGGKGVFRSIDNGSSWTNLNSGLFAHSISALVTDGKNVFAGTGIPFWNGSYGDGRGVFMSADSGQHWDTINYGLPQSAVDGGNDFLSVNALGVFDTLLFVGVWDDGGTMNRTYVRSIPEILRQKGDTTASVVSEPIASDSIEIYPNPSVGTVTIRSGGTLVLSVSVLNVLGVQMLTIPKAYSSEFTLDLSKLPSGTYFLEIETQKGVVLRKIVRE